MIARRSASTGSPSSSRSTRSPARPSWSSCWPATGSSPPRPRSRATSRSWAPSRCACPGGDTVYAIPELPKERVAPEDHLRRVLGDWVVEVAALGQPRRAAHAARLGPRGRVGPRPGRARRHPRHVAGDDTLIVVASRAYGGGQGRQAPVRPGRPRSRMQGARPMAKRVVLAYSGGLDTSVAVRWLRRSGASR